MLLIQRQEDLWRLTQSLLLAARLAGWPLAGATMDSLQHVVIAPTFTPSSTLFSCRPDHIALTTALGRLCPRRPTGPPAHRPPGLCDVTLALCRWVDGTPSLEVISLIVCDARLDALMDLALQTELCMELFPHADHPHHKHDTATSWLQPSSADECFECY